MAGPRLNKFWFQSYWAPIAKSLGEYLELTADKSNQIMRKFSESEAHGQLMNLFYADGHSKEVGIVSTQQNISEGFPSWREVIDLMKSKGRLMVYRDEGDKRYSFEQRPTRKGESGDFVTENYIWSDSKKKPAQTQSNQEETERIFQVPDMKIRVPFPGIPSLSVAPSNIKVMRQLDQQLREHDQSIHSQSGIAELIQFIGGIDGRLTNTWRRYPKVAANGGLIVNGLTNRATLHKQ